MTSGEAANNGDQRKRTNEGVVINSAANHDACLGVGACLAWVDLLPSLGRYCTDRASAASV